MAQTPAPTRTGANGLARSMALNCMFESALRLVVMPQSGQGMCVSVLSGQGIPVPSGVMWSPMRPTRSTPDRHVQAVRWSATDLRCHGAGAAGMGGLRAESESAMVPDYRVWIVGGMTEMGRQYVLPPHLTCWMLRVIHAPSRSLQPCHARSVHGHPTVGKAG